MHLHRPIHRPIVRSIVDVVLGVPRPGPRRAVVMSTCAGVGAFTLLGLWALHVERRPASRARWPPAFPSTSRSRTPTTRARRPPSFPRGPSRCRRRGRHGAAHGAPVRRARRERAVRAGGSRRGTGPERARQSDRRDPGGGRCQRLRRRRDPDAGHEHGPWPRKSNAGKPVASVGRRRRRRRAGPLRAGRPRESELVMSLAERGGSAAIDEETVVIRVVVRPDGSAESVAVDWIPDTALPRRLRAARCGRGSRRRAPPTASPYAPRPPRSGCGSRVE